MGVIDGDNYSSNPNRYDSTPNQFGPSVYITSTATPIVGKGVAVFITGLNIMRLNVGTQATPVWKQFTIN